MQIQQRWLSSSLSKAVCHGNGGRLLQTEHIFEVRREVLKKWLLCRTRVPEDGCQSESPQQAVGGVVNGQRFLVTHDSLLRAYSPLSLTVLPNQWTFITLVSREPFLVVLIQLPAAI